LQSRCPAQVFLRIQSRKEEMQSQEYRPKNVVVNLRREDKKQEMIVNFTMGSERIGTMGRHGNRFDHKLEGG